MALVPLRADIGIHLESLCTALGLLWDYFGITLESILGDFGVTLGSPGGNLGALWTFLVVHGLFDFWQRLKCYICPGYEKQPASQLASPALEGKIQEQPLVHPFLWNCQQKMGTSSASQPDRQTDSQPANQPVRPPYQ